MNGRSLPRARLDRLALVIAVGGAVVCAATRVEDLGGTGGIAAGEMVAGILLAASVTLSYLFPIHLPNHRKVWLSTPLLFALVAVLSVPMAVICTVSAILAGELLSQSSRGSHTSDIVRQTLRWGAIAALAAAVNQLSPAPLEMRLILTAMTMWLADTLSLPVMFVSISRQRPIQIIGESLKDGGPMEGAQYLLGLFAVFLVDAPRSGITLALVLAAAASAGILVFHLSGRSTRLRTAGAQSSSSEAGSSRAEPPRAVSADIPSRVTRAAA